MISEICQRAMNKSHDRLQVQEMHDKCPELLDLNGENRDVSVNVILIKYSHSIC
jgi:hypothetical protein